MAVLRQFMHNEHTIKHVLAVEASMRAYATRFGEDVEKWGVVGLLHDYDYEIHPTLDEHPQDGIPHLRQLGYPEDVLHAILAHADHTGASRDSLMDKTIFAVDELTGFITAVSLVRPSKSIMDVEVDSIRKKMKDKAFARQIKRDDLMKGAEILDLTWQEHFGVVLKAMQGIAAELGLAGTPS